MANNSQEESELKEEKGGDCDEFKSEQSVSNTSHRDAIEARGFVNHLLLHEHH